MSASDGEGVSVQCADGRIHYDEWFCANFPVADLLSWALASARLRKRFCGGAPHKITELDRAQAVSS